MAAVLEDVELDGLAGGLLALPQLSTSSERPRQDSRSSVLSATNMGGRVSGHRNRILPAIDRAMKAGRGCAASASATLIVVMVPAEKPMKPS